MKILWVEPGSAVATADVSEGLLKALKAQGHDVGRYAMGQRMLDAWKYVSLRLGTKDPPRDQVLWVAGNEVISVALMHEADWVVVVAGANFHPDHLVILRRAGVKVAMVFTESPYEDLSQARVARECRVVFTNERVSVDYLNQFAPAYYLPHSFDPARHYPRPVVDRDGPDVLFVGTGWEERIEFLSEVDWSGIDLALYGSWTKLPKRHKLRRFLRGKEVPNEVAVDLYRTAKINLNLYRTRASGSDLPHITQAQSLNPRAVELSACGLFYLSDWREEIGTVLNNSVPVFYSPKDLGLMVRGFLSAPHLQERYVSEALGLIQSRTFDQTASFLAETLAAHS